MFSSALPLGNSLPVEGVQVVEDSRSIDDEIILAVIDKDFSFTEDVDDVAGVAPGNIVGKRIIDVFVSGHKVYSFRDSQFAAAVVEEGCEGLIRIGVLSEVVSAHSSPVLRSCIVVVSQKVKVGRSLDK